VGESGCGKSTLGRLALGLTRPDGGRVLVEGTDLASLRREQLRLRRRQMQAIFQDPLGSLDPRFTAAQSIEEPLRAFGVGDAAARRARVAQLLEQVGLDPAKATARPRELSGGQRQRVVIARAIALRPRLIVADEPVSALDVSVQAQIINLLCDLQEELGVGYLFIAHDLAVVRHVADRVGVMYLGRIVETGPAAAVLGRPLHPYTAALGRAVPRPDGRLDGVLATATADAAAAAPTSGCAFRGRCPRAAARCADEVPLLRAAETGHWVACHFPDHASATAGR
jgi:oligopeptide/dipeptide ABC transporter ATP-binding protein